MHNTARSAVLFIFNIYIYVIFYLYIYILFIYIVFCTYFSTFQVINFLTHLINFEVSKKIKTVRVPVTVVTLVGSVQFGHLPVRIGVTLNQYSSAYLMAWHLTQFLESHVVLIAKSLLECWERCVYKVENRNQKKLWAIKELKTNKTKRLVYNCTDRCHTYIHTCTYTHTMATS